MLHRLDLRLTHRRRAPCPAGRDLLAQKRAGLHVVVGGGALVAAAARVAALGALVVDATLAALSRNSVGPRIWTRLRLVGLRGRRLLRHLRLARLSLARLSLARLSLAILPTCSARRLALVVHDDVRAVAHCQPVVVGRQRRARPRALACPDSVKRRLASLRELR